MPWSSQAFIASVIIVQGDNGGVFIYNTAGQLIASMADLANVDPQTSSNKTGITSYTAGGGLFGQLDTGFLNFGSNAGGTTITQSGVVRGTDASSAGVTPAILIVSPSSNASAGVSQINLSGESQDGTGQPQIALEATQTQIGIAGGKFIVFLSPTGSAATDTTALATALSSGYLPWLLPGTFSINCGNATLTNLGPGQTIYASGEHNTIISAVGSGDLFGWQQTGAYNGFTTIGGGIRGGCTIDMGATTATSNGIHAGDIEGLIFEATVQNATQAGSFGFLFDNRNHFTERMRGDITAKNCDTHVAFTVSGATTSTKSFARPNMDIKITQGASSNGDGVQLLNGAELYDGRLSIRGNFSSSASALTSAVLRVTGSVPVGHPGAGTLSKIDHCQLDIGVEVDSAHANTPSTIIYGASGNNIKANGNMDFIGAFTASNLNGGNMVYDGLIDGDTTIGSRFYYGQAPAQTITANGQTIVASGVSAVHPVGNTLAATGLIMGAGAFGGQVIWVMNVSLNALTFAASPGSNLAGNVNVNLPVGGSKQLVWETSTSLWYGAA